MKKVISITLAFFMILSAACFALTPEEAAKDIGKYGIMGGFPDGSLRLEENVTRAQIAKMIVIAINEKGLSGAMSSFSDVPKGYWATEFIEVARNKNIIGGFPNGTFKPGDNVTYEQAIKMIVCALKYDEYELDRRPTVGGQKPQLYYPMDYIRIAQNNGLLEGFSVDMSKPATRGFVAVVLSRALDLPVAVELGEYSFSFEGSQMDPTSWEILDGKDGRELKTLRTALGG